MLAKNENITNIATSNWLAELAARIKAEHEAAAAALKRSLEHGIAAGELLLEAKAQVPHDQRLPWLKDHCGMPDRTARLYMRLARHRDEIGNVADLTVRGAINLLARSNDEADADEAIPVHAPRSAEHGEHEIPIDDVRFDPKLYPRSCFHPDVVARYREFLPALPPIEINQRNVLIDGWHRLEAHKEAGAATTRVVVTEVADNLDHLELAIKRNATHGLQFPIRVERRYRHEVKKHPLQRPKATRKNKRIELRVKARASN
jgi:hypothetical protein